MNTSPLGTQDAIKFGFGVPQTVAQPADIEVIRRVAVAAEEAGFVDLWLSDAASGGASLDPLTLLPFLAAITSRVRLGVSVLVLPVHHPLHLARRIATTGRIADLQARLFRDASQLGTPAGGRTAPRRLAERRGVRRLPHASAAGRCDACAAESGQRL